MATKTEEKKPGLKEKMGLIVKKAKLLTDAISGMGQILAVDMGSYAVKVAAMGEEGGKFRLKAWGYIPLNLKPEATAEERSAKSLSALRAFLIERGIKAKHAATALSGNSVIVRYVKFPLLTRAELSSILAAEAEPFIPFDINEVQLGFHILNELMEEGQKKMETVLVAAKKDLVSSRIDTLRAAGLLPVVMDVDSFAIENVHERLKGSKNDAGASLCLNIGHSVTNLSIISGGVTRVVRDIFIAGGAVTKAVMKALSCDYAKAEDIKREHGLLTDEQKEKNLQEGKTEALAALSASQAASQVIKDLVGEIRRSVDFYLSQGNDRAISRVLLCGGTAALKNLPGHLGQELKVPVNVIDAFSFADAVPPDFPRELAPVFGVASGLALRRWGDWL